MCFHLHKFMTVMAVAKLTSTSVSRISPFRSATDRWLLPSCVKKQNRKRARRGSWKVRANTALLLCKVLAKARLKIKAKKKNLDHWACCNRASTSLKRNDTQTLMTWMDPKYLSWSRGGTHKYIKHFLLTALLVVVWQSTHLAYPALQMVQFSNQKAAHGLHILA